jgi:hypothetical protein
MSVSDDGPAAAEEPAAPPEPEQPVALESREPIAPEPVAAEQPAAEASAQPVVTFVDGEPVVSYGEPPSDDAPTPPFGFPAPGIPKPRRSFRKVWLSLLAAVVVVALVAVGYTVVRFLVDRSTYKDGHAAYEKAECPAAVGHFDDVITAWRLIKLGDTVSRAESEKAECLRFQEAVKRQDAGDPPGALTSYATFIPDRPPSPLVEAARSRGADLFKQVSPDKLASVDSCNALQVLREQRILDTSLTPKFLAACGAAYVAGGDRTKAVAIYVKLFSEFSTDPTAAATEVALQQDVGWCSYRDVLRREPILSALKDLIPGLLLNCAKNPKADPETAIKYTQEFFKDFSAHRLAPEALAVYAALLNKQARADGQYHDFGGEHLDGSAGGGQAVIMLYNDSPEKFRIALSGPEPRVEEIEPCAECPTEKSGSEHDICRPAATGKRIVIAPGEYDIAMDYPESRTPTNGGFGHWNLRPGKQYFGCYSVIEAPR